MTDQKTMNRATWASLQDKGVAAGSSLVVDTFTVASDERSAHALAGELERRGWQMRGVLASRRGVLRRKVDWEVLASRQIDAVDLVALDAMVDEMESLARAHGATFDGWGAETPE